MKEKGVYRGGLTHGLFSEGFMLCDRCVWNTRCDRFEPGGICSYEREFFERIVGEILEEFELDNVVDRIMVERAAMYLIRIARAEGYEAAVGITDKSPVWGRYLTRADNTLRRMLNDLAVTRLKRKQLGRHESFLVSVDDVIKKFAKAEAKHREKEEEPGEGEGVKVDKRRVVLVDRAALVSGWRQEYSKLRWTVRRRRETR